MLERPIPEPANLVALFVLAVPVASIAWTFTHEELFRELREWCKSKSRFSPRLLQRKFFYVLTCEYCFSHYVTAAILFLSRYRLLYPGWRGYLVSGFSLVWIANIYMSLYGRIRLDLRRERVEIASREEETRHETPVVPHSAAGHYAARNG